MKIADIVKVSTFVSKVVESDYNDQRGTKSKMRITLYMYDKDTYFYLKEVI